MRALWIPDSKRAGPSRALQDRTCGGLRHLTASTFKEALTDFSAREQAKKAEELQPITVSAALRKQPGRYTAEGVIISRSDPYNLITKTKISCQNCSALNEIEYEKPEATIEERRFRSCPACNEPSVKVQHEYINAVTIWLQDKEPQSELERLPVVLFNKDNEHIGTGELVSITGQLHIVKTGRMGRLAPIIHAENIRYHNREELTLTPRDIEGIKRFASLNQVDSCGVITKNIYPKRDLIDRLTSMVGLSVVGHKIPKQGILLAAVGTEYIDTRVHVLFAGDPGEAKSKLSSEATKLIPNSKYVTAQYSTGRSMTAIIDKDNDMYVLKYGPAAMAKQAFCAINELGKLTFEDQGYLYDVMQEGHFNLNKHGFDKPIEAPTTIIATTNPIGATWQDADRISDSELPIIQPLRDRFDLLFVFRRDNSIEANRKFAYEMSEREGKESRYNHNFIRKYIHYAKKIKPTLTDEAKAMLNEHWTQIATNDAFSSKRILQSLFKIAKGFARLYLKDTADIAEAQKAIQFYNLVLSQYGRSITAPVEPRILTMQKIQAFVLKTAAPVTFEYALEQVAKEDPQIAAYLGKKTLKPESNKKVRAVYDMLKQSPGANISIVNQKPLTFSRSDRSDRSGEKAPTDPNDPSDPPKPSSNNKQRLFMQIFNDLAKDNDHQLVDAEQLKKELITSGKFDAGEAHQIIKDNLATNAIYEYLAGKYKKA